MPKLMSSLVLVALGATSAFGEAPKGPEGVWLGTLEVGAQKLRLAFEVKKAATGYAATMKSLDQSPQAFPVVMTYATPALRFEIAALGASFEGTLAGDTASGTFTQGKPFPLVLKRVERLDAPSRPQVPKRPFPYREEEVSLAVAEHPRAPARASAAVKLSGTLTLPAGQGPFPAVLFVTGSGPQDRDETIFEHKPFLVLADALTRAGIATLRFDDRGVGKSEGSARGLTTLDLADDAERELEYLASRPEVDKRAIAIVGHSEGALIAPIVATQSKLVRLVVMLAGTGMTGDKVLLDQIEAIGRSAGATSAKLAADRRDLVSYYGALRAATTDEAIDRAAAAYVAADPTRAPSREAIMRTAHDPWFRAFLMLDPIPYLKAVAVPVLAISGEKDVQVLPANLPLIEGALRRGKCPDVTVRLLPALNHLFQHAKNGTPSEYGALEETFAPDAIKLVTDWIVERAARARR